MHILKKGQLVFEARAEGLTAAEQFYALVAKLLTAMELTHPKRLPMKICDRTRFTAPARRCDAATPRLGSVSWC
jgi:hypothetical protein